MNKQTTHETERKTAFSDGQEAAQTGKRGKGKGKPRPNVIELNQSDLEALQNITQAEGDSQKPYYNLVKSGINAGLYFYDVGTAKDGTQYIKPPVKLSDPITIIGLGKSTDGKAYRLLKVKPTGSREEEIIAFPLESVGRPDGWAFLRSHGAGIRQNTVTMAHLANYLQWEGEQTEYRFTKTGGWCDESQTAYVLANGEIIGEAAKPVFYIGDLSKHKAYKQAGSLEDWQQHIARYTEGNSRLLLALGAVFAAPLLAITKQEGGGFHFFGSSSIGKSISGKVAMSVIGNPEQLKIQWNGTGLSFDNYAAANSDGALFLDEMGQADGRALDYASYAVFNGVKKGQAAKEGGNREHLTWRVLVISNGEYEPEHFMRKYNYEWQAGQAVRLPAIPADAGAGYGTFDTLHGFERPELLAAHLEQSVNLYHGAAWRAYLSQLTQAMQQDSSAFKARLLALQNAFLSALPSDLSSQPIRAAKRFALACAALELAGEWGITGLAQGVGAAGVKTCFDAWLEHAGKENKEESDIMKTARSFMMLYGLSERFTRDPKQAAGEIDYLGENIETNRNHAGFRLDARRTGETPTWYILDKVFEEEICKGKNIRLVCSVLEAAGWLWRDGRNYKRRVPPSLIGQNLLPKNTRMYCLRGIAPPETEESGTDT
ncbi:DUF927 domain-containing protein [Neisseria sp. ZJ106]|uniref:DUF927 domain-containing protein n=1 Tax=Neisseria lisongii TaxID=2912188 RepID=A0ABY7RKF2_9NEIS|nr:DUF927 domain-containing protein [Neisseria lisongii]MCF7520483.1 DUF927 domain-containing protein [Neisseria lisongii]WCL71575.1 DUF927 domain-containing protein [Neisseria lisongii]